MRESLRTRLEPLRASFTLPAAETDAIRSALETARSVDRVYTVRLVDAQGTVCAEVDKTLYVRKRDRAE